MGYRLSNDEIREIIEVAQERDMHGNPVTLDYIAKKTGHAEITVKKYCKNEVGVGNGKGGLLSRTIDVRKHDDEIDASQILTLDEIELPKKPAPSPFTMLDDVKTVIFQRSQNVYVFSKRSENVKAELHSGATLEINIFDIPDLIKELEQIGHAKLLMENEH